MLISFDAIATVAVHDLAQAARFDEDTLDLTPLARQGDIHISGAMRVVWVKDPDGNIFNPINA